ncbi:MAG: undecaprenyl-diphosphatase UppP [Acidobacteriaceae bacterium]|nr:undecaprenyl-diphosphatase UppP [Acidobacteriaceae bacterium]
MPLYQAILLAVVQGLTEFLPISSTAHLAVVPRLLGWTDRGLDFDVALHAGTLAAVLIYFFRDWVQVIANGLGFSYRGVHPDENSRSLLWFLVVATIPVGIAGKTLKEYAEGPWRNLFVIGASLILVGLVMGVADRVRQRKTGLDQMTWLDAIFVGIGQAFAIIPGISRSGITITAARFRELDREAAARFSFLLSTPAIAAAAASDYFEMRKNGGIPADMRAAYPVGILVSAVVGLLVIAFLLRYLRHNSLSIFVWYRVIFGIILIALAFFLRNGG